MESATQNKFKRSIIVIIICAILFITSPAVIGFVSIIWLYRRGLNLWIKLFKPKIGPLIGGVDSVFLSRSPYTEEQRTTISYYATVEGKIDLEEFRAVVKKGLVKYRENNESGRKLFQRITTWAGFFVNEDETNFNLDEHVRLFSFEELNERIERQCGPKMSKMRSKKKIHQEHLTPNDLAQLGWSLLRVPFENDKSAWEILLIYNPQGLSEKIDKTGIENHKTKFTTTIFLRIHHALADGLAVNSMFYHFFDQTLEHSFGRSLHFFTHDSNSNKHEGTKIFKNCADFVLGLPEFISYLLKCTEINWPPHAWHKNYRNRRSFQSDYDKSSPADPDSNVYAVSYEYSKDKIDGIKKCFQDRKIKTSTILYAALSRSLSDFYNTNKNKHHESFDTFSQTIYALNVFGESRSRKQLTNSITLVGTRLPFGPELMYMDAKSVLMDIEDSFLYAKNSRLRFLTTAAANLLGLLPLKLKPHFQVFCKGMCITNLPSFENPVTLLQNPVLSTKAVAIADLSDPPPACVLIFNFETGDKVHGCFTVAQSMLNSYDDAQVLTNYFVKQFDKIHQEIVQG